MKRNKHRKQNNNNYMFKNEREHGLRQRKIYIKPPRYHPISEDPSFKFQNFIPPIFGNDPGGTKKRAKKPNRKVEYINSYSPDVSQWTWVQWVQIIGQIIIFGIIVAGFIYFWVEGGRRCCL
jgi:hypothetical protein